MWRHQASISRKIIMGTIIPIACVFLMVSLVVQVLLRSQMDHLFTHELVPLIDQKVRHNDSEVGNILALLVEQMSRNHAVMLASFTQEMKNLAAVLATAALPHAEVFDYDAITELVQQYRSKHPQVRFIRVFYEKDSPKTIEAGNAPNDPIAVAQEATSEHGYVKVELLTSSTALKDAFASETQQLTTVKNRMQDINTSFADEVVAHKSSLTTSLLRRINLRVIPLFVVAVLLIAVGLFTFLKQLLIRPIREICRVVSALADGDVTQTAKGTFRGELAVLRDAVHTSGGNLKRVMEDIRAVTTSIVSALSQLSAGNTDLSQRTQEQASALAETASSMAEMTSTVQQNADNARQANQLAASARSQAEQGGAVVSQAVAAMAVISHSSRQIADITSVIDSIAFQTNLLALNAAVEAARAGELGRGFAVVAAEVRRLAQRSAEAAKEIKALIADSGEKVESGTRLVDESGTVLAEIVTAVKKVSDIVAEITAASQEQSAGIEQVNKAVMQMDAMTQQNAALVEEAAAASGAVEAQAQHLRQLMAFFQVEAQAQREPGMSPTVSPSCPSVTAPHRCQPVGSVALTPVVAATVQIHENGQHHARQTYEDDSNWREF